MRDPQGPEHGDEPTTDVDSSAAPGTVSEPRRDLTLDGLRALAVLLVVAFHAEVPGMANGFVGVDVFFVLSGFLITRLLDTELTTTGTLSLRRFYSRRVRRLLPAALTASVGITALWLLTSPITRRLDLVADARAASLSVANWHFVATSTDYFADTQEPSPFLHFWSLAVEEQFYVAYPLVLLVAWHLGRRRRSALGCAVISLGIASLVAQFVVSATASSATAAYLRTDTRAYQLLAGGALALVLARRPAGDRPRTATSHGRAFVHAAIAVTSGATIIALATTLLDLPTSARGLATTLATVALLTELALRADDPPPVLGRVLGHRVAVAVGHRSYAIYLWHWPLVLVLRRTFDPLPLGPRAGAVLLALTVVVLSSVIAEASARWVEGPVRRASSLDRVPLRVVALALALSIGASAALPAVLRLAVRPVSATISTTRPSVVNTTDPDPALAEAMNTSIDAGSVEWAADGRVALTDLAETPVCALQRLALCTRVEGDGLRVLVVGDSHALVMLPALEKWAEAEGHHLDSGIVLGCAWEEGIRNLGSDRKRDDPCWMIRHDWPRWMQSALQPDVVMLIDKVWPADDYSTAAQRGPAAQFGIEGPDLDHLPPMEALVAARRATVRSLRALGLPVVIVEDVPPAPFDPYDCLATTSIVGECAWDGRQTDPTETAMRALAATDPGVVTVDLDDLLCPFHPVCLPYVDGQFVVYDPDHAWPEWWVRQSVPLAARLTSAVEQVLAAGDGSGAG